MDELQDIGGYRWDHACLGCMHGYTLPPVLQILRNRRLKAGLDTVFDLGCGNGAIMDALHQEGFAVAGVDPSQAAVEQARKAYPHLRIEVGSAYDDLASKYGQFPVVISLDVVEHCFFPRKYAQTLHALVRPGGVAILSTPYHGYWKNLSLALSGAMDRHFTALWDYGHIKFWSMKTLGILLKEARFGSVGFLRVGRIPPLARCMLAMARK